MASTKSGQNKKRRTTATVKKRKSSSRSSAGRKQTGGISLTWEFGHIVGILFPFFLFLCMVHLIGSVGNFIANVAFGFLGFLTYIFPIFLLLVEVFHIVNAGIPEARKKIFAASGLFVLFQILFELFQGNLNSVEKLNVIALWTRCFEKHNGGGVVAGSLAYFMYHYLSTAGTILVVVALGILFLVILTNRSFVRGFEQGSRQVASRTREGAKRYQEYAQEQRNRARQNREEYLAQLQEDEETFEESFEEPEIAAPPKRRVEKKISGVMLDTSLNSNADLEDAINARDNLREITYNGPSYMEEPQMPLPGSQVQDEPSPDTTPMPVIHISGVDLSSSADSMETVQNLQLASIPFSDAKGAAGSISELAKEPVASTGKEPVTTSYEKPSAAEKVEVTAEELASTQDEIQEAAHKAMLPYRKPSLSLLKINKNSSKGDSSELLRETAKHLEQTLATFGVRVTITDISRGPSVTRYELQPEQGVKVSKIVSLSDDIKLNLAATDIRIEAPIPGKAAVGIEVPNKENSAVGLRELLETNEFQQFPSNLAIAVGKDIAGKTVVSDIAKMPHVLIAGATGSGKSVCINTIIMSLLYKASPEDVKMIMVDPKVVELSVYNGIPHLLIPVVTDPKKAAGALNWGVQEMTDRYKKFAEYNVRDIKGFNQMVEKYPDKNAPDAPTKMPQIVIIVDELADLMMVAPGEVEESICRLAQLARAAGIHLIIATQRPSVDVITGLIKANMPSRIAFAVSSGVDSRTILDMVGAEKLLGKGDMLFYPQGYTKPARVQGAFVSDEEVSDVVDFLKNQAIGNVYDEAVEEQMNQFKTSGGKGVKTADGGDGGSQLDELFADAGQFIIDKDKASIGMLQRVFKIGFNRAARIMDQLCEAGVVGEEEGTKPRKILMSAEEFQQFKEEYL